MSTLAQELDRYLAIRHSLGYDLRTSAGVLRRFAAFACVNGAKYPRLGMVRQFAQWLGGIDPRNEVPPKGLIPGRYRRSRPYIYSDQEIVQIIEEAALPAGAAEASQLALFATLHDDRRPPFERTASGAICNRACSKIRSLKQWRAARERLRSGPSRGSGNRARARLLIVPGRFRGVGFRVLYQDS